VDTHCKHHQPKQMHCGDSLGTSHLKDIIKLRLCRWDTKSDYVAMSKLMLPLQTPAVHKGTIHRAVIKQCVHSTDALHRNMAAGDHLRSLHRIENYIARLTTTNKNMILQVDYLWLLGRSRGAAWMALQMRSTAACPRV